MHHLAFVVTTEKPTEELLAKTLEPFRCSVDNPDGPLDWFALGGRYTGNIMACPHADSTITGGLVRPAFEMLMEKHDVDDQQCKWQFRRTTGPGVDAAQFKHIHHPLVRPVAVVANGQWHQSPDMPDLQAREMSRRYGFPMCEEWETENAGKCDEQLAAYEAGWARMVSEVLDPCGPDDWLSIVDYHR